MSSDETKPPHAEPPALEMLAWCATFWDPRALRKVWLDTWSRAADDYLRTAAFLELMQAGLQTMVESIVVEGDSHR
jgi:hypothetical protein